MWSSPRPEAPSRQQKRADPLDTEAPPLPALPTHPREPPQLMENRVLVAAPQTCQACPSPRYSFQNTESKTGPTRAAFSQGQGLSP